MAITALLELHIKPELVTEAPGVVDEVLVATRAFHGNLGVEVVSDIEDPAHIVLIEHWADLDADNAYRAFRAGEGQSPLGRLLAGAPTLTRYSD